MRTITIAAIAALVLAGVAYAASLRDNADLMGLQPYPNGQIRIDSNGGTAIITPDPVTLPMFVDVWAMGIQPYPYYSCPEHTGYRYKIDGLTMEWEKRDALGVWHPHVMVGLTPAAP